MTELFSSLDNEAADTATLYTIGQGFCGTVWASKNGPVYKREDGGPGRSLLNDFEMHNRVFHAFRRWPSLQIQIPACYDFIKATDQPWWNANRQKFPSRYRTPCNMIHSQRIPPFPEPVRRLLIEAYCPPNIISEIMASEPNKDCLIRPYLGRRRTQKPNTTSKFKAFSLRNFPLHMDQLEALGVKARDQDQYARIMAETLALIHWIGEIDGNDIEFVLAPPCNNPSHGKSSDDITTGRLKSGLSTESDVLGDHSVWVLDFDLCRGMTMNSTGMEQAAAAFWRNDPYYPRPGRTVQRDMALWIIFKKRYLETSEACIDVTVDDLEEKQRRCVLSKQFIELVEQGRQTRELN